MLAGTDKNGMRKFDKYEAQFGKWAASKTETGKAILANFAKDAPMTKELATALEGSRSFRFGKILALDIYATTAALAIWTTVSKFSAILRSRKGVVAQEAALAIAQEDTKSAAPEQSDGSTVSHNCTPDRPSGGLSYACLSHPGFRRPGTLLSI